MTSSPNQEALAQVLERWQERLKLRDWHITIRFATYADMDNGDAQGLCQCDEEQRQARIRILHPDHYPSDSWLPQDIEATVVHELLHVLLEPFGWPASRRGQIGAEQALNALSSTLVSLARQ